MNLKECIMSLIRDLSVKNNKMVGILYLFPNNRVCQINVRNEESIKIAYKEFILPTKINGISKNGYVKFLHYFYVYHSGWIICP